MTLSLSFAEFSQANRARAKRWHGDIPWSRADWFVAALGELGESANVAKKLKRAEDGIIGNKEGYNELRPQTR